MIETIGEILTVHNRKVVASLERDEDGTFVVLKGHIKSRDAWIPEKVNTFRFNPKNWAGFKELVKKIDQAMVRKGRRKARFGMVAIQKGFVTLRQVIDALGIQARENLSTGRHKHIGQIMLEQGVIDRSQLDEVLHTLQHMRRDVN